MGGDSEKPLHEILSDREYQVMMMIASGNTVGAIAKELVPEREDDQQLSDQHPAEDEDEEQRGNNALRHKEQPGGLIRPGPGPTRTPPAPLPAIGRAPKRTPSLWRRGPPLSRPSADPTVRRKAHERECCLHRREKRPN